MRKTKTLATNPEPLDSATDFKTGLPADLQSAGDWQLLSEWLARLIWQRTDTYLQRKLLTDFYPGLDTVRQARVREMVKQAWLCKISNPPDVVQGRKEVLAVYEEIIRSGMASDRFGRDGAARDVLVALRGKCELLGLDMAEDVLNVRGAIQVLEIGVIAKPIFEGLDDDT